MFINFIPTVLHNSCISQEIQHCEDSDDEDEQQPSTKTIKQRNNILHELFNCTTFYLKTSIILASGLGIVYCSNLIRSEAGIAFFKFISKLKN